MVNAHPQIAITPEAHWIPRFFEERRGLTPEGVVTPDMIQQLLKHPKFANFHIQPQDLLGLIVKERPTSYASLLTGIFDLYGQARGKALVGNKTPDSVRKLRTLHMLWPETRFVHLIRDGRDVALSFMKWPKVLQKKPGNLSTWKDDPFSTAALWWELNVRCGLRAFEWLDPKLCYEMRYESLIANPRKECAALCEFLKLPYDESMLRFHEGREESMSGDTMNPAWQPITAGLRDWRTQTSEENVERFEAVAGELLDELGYARAFPQPRAEILEGASRIRNLIAQDLQDLTLPKAPLQAACHPVRSPGNTHDVRETIER
jgi:hypothetical protein